MHRRIADHYWSKHHGDWSRCDDYGLRSLAVRASWTRLAARDDLLDLLQPEWIQAKWDTFGSYSALIGDMDIACKACLKEPRNDAAIAGLAIARRAARDLMQRFPTDLLVAWSRRVI